MRGSEIQQAAQDWNFVVFQLVTNMRLSLRAWLGIVGFQIFLGAAIFVITRHFYYHDPEGAAQLAQVTRSSPGNSPHAIPGRIAGQDNALLVGSERFTTADAQRLTMAATKDNASPRWDPTVISVATG